MGTFLTIVLTLAFVVLPIIFGKKGDGSASHDTRRKRPAFERDDRNFEGTFGKGAEKEQFLYEEYNVRDVAKQRNDGYERLVEESDTTKEEVAEKISGEFNLRDAVVYSVILHNPYTERS